MIKEITTREAFNLIDGTQEEIPISGMYVKLNNVKRDFNGILNKPNPKGTKSGSMRYRPSDLGNLIYWDNGSQQYRTIKSINLKEFVLHDTTYIVVNPKQGTVEF